MKMLLQSVRLALTAANFENAHREIPAEYVDDINAARAQLAMMRGTDVIATLSSIMRGGLPITVDLRPSATFRAEKEVLPPGRR